jgi:hypothetical protein
MNGRLGENEGEEIPERGETWIAKFRGRNNAREYFDSGAPIVTPSGL